MRQLPLGLAAAGFLGFVFYGVAEFQRYSFAALSADPGAFHATLDELEHRPGSARLERARISGLRPDLSLLRPESVLPTIIEKSETAAAFMKAEESCDLSALSPTEEFAKWRQWLEIKCTRHPAPLALISQPPWIHPAGGSWASYMKKHEPAEWRSNLDWQATITKNSHVLEVEKNDGAPWIGTSVLPAEWQAILDGQHWVLTRDHLWIPSDGAFKIVERADFNAILAMFGRKSLTTEFCPVSLTRGLCLVADSDRGDHKRKLGFLGLGAGIALLLSSSALLLWQRREHEIRLEQDRKMVMQTLAHELRHPATSLQLSLEVMRDQFDQLPEDSQTEFLRMLDQVQRLRRVLEASRQYLGSESGASGFQFKKTAVDDIGGFVGETLAAYEGKIRIHFPVEPRTLAIDRYWLGLCITNLVKNALIHGRPPIDVFVASSGPEVVIEVRDRGDAPELSFEEMITPLVKRKESPGMGLGLSLVHRLMDLMGGRLDYLSDPKSFRLRLKEGK